VKGEKKGGAVGRVAKSKGRSSDLHTPTKNPTRIHGCKHTSLVLLVGVFSEVM
jgi:hypothetical protein